MFRQLAEADERFEKVTYEHIPKEEFIPTLINSLAESAAPDLIVLPHTELVYLR